MTAILSGVGKTLKWSLIVGALLIVLVIIAAVVGLGSAANDSQKNSNQVTQAEYEQIHAGMTKAAVRALVGKPESTNSTTVGGTTSTCWEYGALASTSFQFCFSNGKVESKTRL